MGCYHFVQQHRKKKEIVSFGDFEAYRIPLSLCNRLGQKTI